MCQYMERDCTLRSNRVSVRHAAGHQRGKEVTIVGNNRADELVQGAVQGHQNLTFRASAAKLINLLADSQLLSEFPLDGSRYQLEQGILYRLFV